MAKDFPLALVNNLFYLGDLYYLKEINRAIEESSQSLSPVLKVCRQLWFLNVLDQERWGNTQIRSSINL